MEKIKSKLIIKIFFSNFNWKQKLKIIKYNKNLPNKINVKNINYQFLSDYYIIYGNEINRKGKEFNSYDDELLFEGEYLNDKRWNRKGKEYYWNNELIFEGYNINGKRNGKG